MQVFTALAIAISISLDALLVTFAYGCKKIRIPIKSIVIINFICTGVIGVSFFAGNAMSHIIPDRAAAWLAFLILFTIGIIKLFDSITKSLIRKYTKEYHSVENLSKEIQLSIFNFKLVMHIYADPEAADADVSKSISPKEAAVLATSLSLDGFAVGISAAMMHISGFHLVGFTLLIGFFALFLGGALGNKAAKNLRLNLSWLAGVILILLAVLQVV